MSIKERLQKLEQLIKSRPRKPFFICCEGEEPNQNEQAQIEQAEATGNRVFVYTVWD